MFTNRLTVAGAFLGFSLLLSAPLSAQDTVAHAEVGHAAEAHVEHHGHEPATLSGLMHDDHVFPKFIASLISFGLLVFLMVKFARKKMLDGLAARKEELSKALEEASKVRAQAEAKKKELDARLAGLDAEIERVREELGVAAKGERDRIVADAEARAAVIRRDTEFQIEQRMKALKQDLLRESASAAVAAATALVREKATAPDHDRLGEQYLAELKKVAAEVRS